MKKQCRFKIKNAKKDIGIIGNQTNNGETKSYRNSSDNITRYFGGFGAKQSQFSLMNFLFDKVLSKLKIRRISI